MRQHAEQREAGIKAVFSTEKEELANRIEELHRMEPIPMFSVELTTLMLAQNELAVIVIWEEREIGRAWHFYNRLW